MNSFFMNDHFITDISIAVTVRVAIAKPRHIVRPSHGLCIRLENTPPVSYVFSTGKRIDLPENGVIYLPKGSTYIVERKNRDELPQNLFLCRAVNFQIDSDETFEPCVVQSRRADALTEHFKTVCQSWAMRRPGYRTTCVSHLYSVLDILRQEQLAGYIPLQKNELLVPAMRHIDEQLSQGNIYVEKLAELCGISEVYFRKLFHSIYGMPPKQYIAQLRLNNAQALLLSGEYSISEISAMCGYVSESYFSQVFKKAYGIAPGQFQRKNRT